MPELKPCPFCGHDKPKITKKRSGNYCRTGDSIQIICGKCKARGPIFTAKRDEVKDGRGYTLYWKSNPETVSRTEQMAIDAWNRRAHDTNTICGAYAQAVEDIRQRRVADEKAR